MSKKKPVEPNYLYVTGLEPQTLIQTIHKHKNRLDNFIANPSCWICNRPHNSVHGTIQRMGAKGTIITQTNTVRYMDVQMSYGQVIRIPICEICVLLINRSTQKKILVEEVLASQSEDVDNQ